MNTLSTSDRINIWYAILYYRLFPPVLKVDNELIWWPETFLSTKDRLFTAILSVILYISGVLVLFNFSKLMTISTPFVLLYLCIVCSGWVIVATSILTFLMTCKIYDYHPIKKYKEFHLRCGQGDF